MAQVKKPKPAAATAAKVSMEKTPSGIPGFDFVAHGGMPDNRGTLIAGTAGARGQLIETCAVITPAMVLFR